MEFSEPNEKMPVIESAMSLLSRGEERRYPNNTSVSVMACCLTYPDPQPNEPVIMRMFFFQQLLQLKGVL